MQELFQWAIPYKLLILFNFIKLLNGVTLKCVDCSTRVSIFKRKRQISLVYV
jgi:hypothetical protein